MLRSGFGTWILVSENWRVADSVAARNWSWELLMELGNWSWGCLGESAHRTGDHRRGQTAERIIHPVAESRLATGDPPQLRRVEGGARQTGTEGTFGPGFACTVRAPG